MTAVTQRPPHRWAADGEANPAWRANYFRYGVSKRTLSYLGQWTWWRMMLCSRRKHPRLPWKQAHRRYYGADRISEAGITLANSAKIKVERYRDRGAQALPCSAST